MKDLFLSTPSVLVLDEYSPAEPYDGVSLLCPLCRRAELSADFDEDDNVLHECDFCGASQFFFEEDAHWKAGPIEKKIHSLVVDECSRYERYIQAPTLIATIRSKLRSVFLVEDVREEDYKVFLQKCPIADSWWDEVLQGVF